MLRTTARKRTAGAARPKPPRPARAVEDCLVARGFDPGVPPWLTGWDELTELETCLRMYCPGCGARGMLYHPFHHAGEHRYSAVAVCPDASCGAGEEL